MRKLKMLIVLASIVALIGAAAFGVGPAEAATKHFVAQVYKGDQAKFAFFGNNPPVSELKTGVIYQVLQYNSSASETLYSSGGWFAGASKSQPVTAATYASDGGRIDFWCDPTESGDTYVDLLVIDASTGFSTVVRGFTANTRTVIIDETVGVEHNLTIPFTISDTSETSSGVSMSYPRLVKDVRLEVVTASATSATINVGILSTGTGAGDADGFLSGSALATAGFVADAAVPTSGASIDYYPATTYGALIATAITGTGAMTTTSGKYNNGGFSLKGYVYTGGSAPQISYTGSSSDTTSAKGYIHMTFVPLR